VRFRKRSTLGLLLAAAVCVMASRVAFAADGVAPAGPGSALSDAAVDAAVDSSGRSLDVPALAERLRSARYVLLGEIHDDAQHHRLRAALLRALLADGRPTVLLASDDNFNRLQASHLVRVRPVQQPDCKP
jgi:uncharacterized iron-regulated protein